MLNRPLSERLEVAVGLARALNQVLAECTVDPLWSTLDTHVTARLLWWSHMSASATRDIGAACSDLSDSDLFAFRDAVEREVSWQ